MLNGAVIGEQEGRSTRAMRGPDAAPQGSLLTFLGHRLVDHLAAPIEPVRCDAVAQMRLAARPVDGKRGLLELVVRPAHAPVDGVLRLF